MQQVLAFSLHYVRVDMSALPAVVCALDEGANIDFKLAEALVGVNGCQISLSVRQVAEGWQTKLAFWPYNSPAWRIAAPPIAHANTQRDVAHGNQCPLLIVHGNLLIWSTKTYRVAVCQLPSLSKEVKLPVSR